MRKPKGGQQKGGQQMKDDQHRIERRLINEAFDDAEKTLERIFILYSTFKMDTLPISSVIRRVTALRLKYNRSKATSK
jgi:hypothetical protein